MPSPFLMLCALGYPAARLFAVEGTDALPGMIGLMSSFVLNKHSRAWVKGRCEIIAL